MRSEAVTVEATSTGYDYEWADRAYKLTKKWLRRHATFFPQDMEDILGDDLPYDMRDTGHVIKSLLKDGLITPSGKFRRVTYGSHWRPVYFSTLHKSYAQDD